MARQRLQKIMAACGVASRRACELIIAEGRVEVDGEIVIQPGTLVDTDTQVIRCDGNKLRPRRLHYFLLNKPRGVICSSAGAPDKPRAIDYVPEQAAGERLFTIGRLDVASEGALILTNDGDLAHKVSHPRFEVEKRYRAEVDGSPTDATLARMRKGVWLAEGRTGPVSVTVLKRMRNKSVLELKIKEGRQREVRRICARFGHEVRRLVRTSIGPVELGRLPRGRVRSLTPAEIDALRDTTDAIIRLGSPRAAAARRTRSGARRRGRRPGPGGPGKSIGKSKRKPTGKATGKTSGKPKGRPTGTSKRKSTGRPAGKPKRTAKGRATGKAPGRAKGKSPGKRGRPSRRPSR